LTPRLPATATARLVSAAAAVALLAAVPSWAVDFASVDPSRDAAGRLGVTFRLDDPLGDRVQQSLERGMPATLELHAELWRKRTGWFDRVERSIDATVRLRHDVWAQSWRLERAGSPSWSVGTVDSLEIALTRPIAMTFPDSGRLPASATYFVVLSVTVKPISVEDAEEVEGWLSGEVRSPRGGGFGALTALPRALFDAVRNIAGLGDSRARAVSVEFSPADLARH
jgi:Domain of unknown function (DUF4390)